MPFALQGGLVVYRIAGCPEWPTNGLCSTHPRTGTPMAEPKQTT